MKLVLIFGSGAVGKMTVGQALAKKTGLRLFHNHMTIEPVIEIFGSYNGKVTDRLRWVIFEEFAASKLEGMIFTFIWAFDQQADRDYVRRLHDLFTGHGAEVCFVELIADQSVRLQRNRTENRLNHKASKRDTAASEARLLREEATHRLASLPGEITYPNYLRLDNTSLTPDQAADLIISAFKL